MARFDRPIKTAIKLIAKNGELVIWRVIEEGFTFPNQPWNPGPSTMRDYNVTICFLPINRQTMETFTFIEGTKVLKGAVMGLMGQVPFVPNMNDVIIRNEKTLRPANITVLSPNGQKILYTMVLKQ